MSVYRTIGPLVCFFFYTKHKNEVRPYFGFKEVGNLCPHFVLIWGNIIFDWVCVIGRRNICDSIFLSTLWLIYETYIELGSKFLD